MIPHPSALSEDQFLIYVVGPIGGAAVIPTLDQIERSNEDISATLTDHDTFEAKRDVVLTQLQDLFRACVEDRSLGQDHYTQAGSLMLWLMHNDPQPLLVDHLDEMRWCVFGIVKQELMVQFGDSDDEFETARTIVVDAYTKATNSMMVPAPKPTMH